MIEFDYLSHHIGTTIYLLGLYVEKWVRSLQWAIIGYVLPTEFRCTALVRYSEFLHGNLKADFWEV